MAGLCFLVLLGAVVRSHGQAVPPLELRRGDHIAIIGNALPDRMQHFGHFETLVHARFPRHELVFRNLAAAGDEVVTRHRSENFGTPDDWLKKVEADVILAFFGYNESFKGPEGLEEFKRQLDTFITETRGKSYSSRGAPRLVLVSPTADERPADPNAPDPAANNARLEAYARAMAEVARERGVLFIDVFQASQELYRAAKAENLSLTVNGHYFTEEGDRRLAPILFNGIFAETAPSGDFTKLRAAIQEKNRQWHQRYRTIDGYNVFGGRSALAYQPGKGGFISDRTPPEPYISNYEVMQQEMSARDVLTANRDKTVWAAAQGSDLPPDDSNLPPIEAVPSNKPGPNPDGSQVYLGGEEAIAHMKIHSGMKVNLFASEEQFPELANPVQMAWDTQHRLWVAVWPNYPERTPDSKVGDSLLIFEDTNGDGKADKVTNFLDDLNAPTGFQFYRDGVIVVQAPDLWFVRDTDGDGRADWKERILMGLDSADSHHTANAICHDPGGAIYLSDGVFHRTQVETAYGPIRNNDAAIYRFEPRTGRFETYVAYGFANPHGRVFDYWGNDIITDATGNANYYGAAFSGYLDYPAKHPEMRQFWNRPSRPCPATGILTSRHFPDEFQGNFLNLNVISFQGVYRVKVSETGSGLEGETLEDLISSTDPNFRPIAISTGPDGAIYFCDWHQSIIGHMQHHLRDPNRDHRHGRIYRMTYEGRPLLKAPKIHGAPIPALLDLLKEPENQTRELAKIELGKRDSAAVGAAAGAWAARLDRNDPEVEHHMMEALWVQQWHNRVDLELLKRMLRSPEPRARAAAGRVLCYWRDRVPEALTWFRTLANDEHPRVRLEAVRAASFFRTAEAAEMALEALRHPMDYYLEYALKESLRQLQPLWRKAIAEGQPIAAYNPQGIDYLVRGVNATELLRLPRTPGVLEAIIARAEVPDADRAAALVELAKARSKSRAGLVLEAIQAKAPSDTAALGALARLLPLQWAEDLKPLRTRVAELAATGTTPEIRQAAWAALAVADDSFDGVWSQAVRKASTLTDLVQGIPLLLDPEFRARAYDRVKPLLSGLPANLEASLRGKPSANGRFVRIELPRRGTLSLAEVQVLSGGRNVALQGKASQSSVGSGGEAARAIDGRTQGDYGSGTITHTTENERRPWWEVDLGSTVPIEAVVVWNRTEGDLGKRLEGFTLSILDDQRQPVVSREGIPAPATSVSVDLADDALGRLRRAAIQAIVSMNREPAGVFADLSALIAKGQEVSAAVQGLRVLPRATWPRAAASSTARDLVRWAESVPASGRTALDFVETVQFAGDLAGVLPASEADSLRRKLRDLRVAVFVIRTVREQMRYDTPRLVVEAGKPFELVIENGDFMPHNLVIVKPGTRDRVGTAAAVLRPDQLDSKGRPYVPQSADVIDATRLLEAGQQQRLRVVAPEVEGDYEYVCTFPGHHQVMWGWLIVSRDVDAYLKNNPEARPAGGGATDHSHHDLE